MQAGTPSKTALRVAMRRAAHQLLDHPLVLEDPIALKILPEESRQKILARVEEASGWVPQGYSVSKAARTRVREKPYSPNTVKERINTGFRAFIVARSCCAEAQLAAAVKAGVAQYVLLGGGLDTFAFRNPFPNLRVFEVDFPATQEWKRGLLEENGIAVPENVVYVPVDFEKQQLREELARAGFDFKQPAFFAWLGVVPYLTAEGFRATASLIGGMPAGSGVTFDYGQPREALPFKERILLDMLSMRVELAGEPFRLFFTPEQVAAELRGLGFTRIEDLDGPAITKRFFRGRKDGLQIKGSAAHLLTAWV